MKLEADDVKNSGRICVATVRDVLENRILIHFDGWDQKYDYWTDISSSNIHPINWHKIGYGLVPPPGRFIHSNKKHSPADDNKDVLMNFQICKRLSHGPHIWMKKKLLLLPKFCFVLAIHLISGQA
jgi:hypothetical protein